MSPKDRQNPEPDDLLLEQDLESLRQASAKIEPFEPPALLDQAVMNKAKQALPKRMQRPPMRWLGAFATATVIVLAFSIVLQQDPQPPAEPNGLRLEPTREAEAPGRSQTAERRAAPQMKQAPPAASVGEERFAAPAAIEPRAAARLSADAEFADEPRQDDRDAEAEAWIERMLQLQSAQRYQELEAELAAFRATYPDYPLPPELED